MEKLVIASDNAGKIKEISKILSGKYEVISMSQAGFKGEIEETGETFYETRLLKPKPFRTRWVWLPLPTTADFA